MVRGRLRRRESRGERVVVRWRKEVVKKARRERRETVRSWVCMLGSGACVIVGEGLTRRNVHGM